MLLYCLLQWKELILKRKEVAKIGCNTPIRWLENVLTSDVLAYLSEPIFMGDTDICGLFIFLVTFHNECYETSVGCRLYRECYNPLFPSTGVTYFGSLSVLVNLDICSGDVFVCHAFDFHCSLC